MGNGGQFIHFWKVTLHAIRKNWLPLSLMLLPPVGHAVLGKRFSAARLRLPYLPAFAALAAAVHFGLMALLPVFGTQPLSAYDLYHNTNDMKQTTAHLGLMPAFRLDVHRLLFGFEDRAGDGDESPDGGPDGGPDGAGAPGRHGAGRPPGAGGRHQSERAGAGF